MFSLELVLLFNLVLKRNQILRLGVFALLVFVFGGLWTHLAVETCSAQQSFDNASDECAALQVFLFGHVFEDDRGVVPYYIQVFALGVEYWQLVRLLAEQVFEYGPLHQTDHRQDAVLSLGDVFADGDQVVQSEAHIWTDLFQVLLQVIFFRQVADQLWE